MTPRSGRSSLPRRQLLLLAAIGALGSMAIHMFVPALPAAARELHAAPGVVQLAVTLYLIGLGAGQLIAGPIAERLGRRPLMLGGLAAFAAGSIAAALAPHVAVLLGARIVQAFGGAAGVVAARIMVSDLTARPEVAARLATLMTILLVSPAISPVIGGAFATLGGWRLIFAVLAILGLLAAFVGYRSLGETRRGPRPEVPGAALGSYARLLRNTRFCRYALASACGSSTLYLFLSASSFLLIRRYGLGPEEAGLCYFLVAAASIAGTRLVALLERRGGALAIGQGLVLLGAALMCLLALAGREGVLALMAPMLLVGLGGGIAAPTSLAGAMHAEEGLAGTGASLAGALQMLTSGLATSLIAQLGLASLASLAVAMLLTALLGFVAAPRGRAVSAA